MTKRRPIAPWRNIASAPLQGDFVLIALPSGMVTIAQFCAEGYWRRSAAQDNPKWEPTHWMPLPEVPND